MTHVGVVHDASEPDLDGDHASVTPFQHQVDRVLPTAHAQVVDAQFGSLRGHAHVERRQRLEQGAE